MILQQVCLCELKMRSRFSSDAILPPLIILFQTKIKLIWEAKFLKTLINEINTHNPQKIFNGSLAIKRKEIQHEHS